MEDKQYSTSYKGKEIKFKISDNRYVVKLRQEIAVSNVIDDIRKFGIEFQQLSGDNVYLTRVSNKFLDTPPFKSFTLKTVLRANRVYERNDRDYFGSASVVLLLKEEMDAEVIEKQSTGKIIDSFSLYRLLKFDNDDLAEEQVGILREKDWVVTADLNFSTIEKVPVDSNMNISNTTHAANIPIPQQLAYDIINVPKLEEPLGRKDVSIAILDTGIDANHYDLTIPMTNQPHWDAIDLDDNPRPLSPDSHGTMCAGIAAAYKTKKYGVDGVGSGCSIISYRIGFTAPSAIGYQRDFKIDLFSILKAFYKAAFEAKASVISCSWGLDTPFETLEYLLQRITLEGRDGKGLPIVFSAGNDKKRVSFPADLDCVITVSAVNLQGEPIVDSKLDGTGWGSNFGDPVDIAAVGVKLVTTDILAHYGQVTAFNKNYNYFTQFGMTSGAAPQVAGCVGLMLSKNANLKCEEVKSILKSASSTFSKTTTKYYGVGILNVEKSLEIINNQNP